MIDSAMVALGALLAAWLHAGNAVWLDDMQSTLLAFNCVLVIMTFPAFGIYQSWRGKPVYDLLWRVTLAWLMVEGAGGLLTFSVHRADLLSRMWRLYWGATVAALLMLSKAVVHATLKSIRREGFNQKAVAIVSAAPYGQFLIEQMRSRPEAGFSPVYVFDENFPEGTLAGVPVSRDLGDLTLLVRGRAIRELWLALPISQEQTINKLVTEFRDDFVNIRFIPDVRSLSFFNHAVVDLLGVPAINLAASPITDLKVLPKRVFDRLFAASVLLCLAPLLIVLAVTVKMSSLGPVFFKQKRKGIDGYEFEIYKFRSMRVHKETAGHVKAKKGDKPVTRVGAFLRRTSLDELPQFINVFRGEMSVVGPRPHALEHDDILQGSREGLHVPVSHQTGHYRMGASEWFSRRDRPH
ncbi:MAG: Undecaprenyl-phosphate galactosephosphotransferase (EC [uncultured Caballeronia sp.]|nr:MAG: Undecaprenyl-phosphate galactosephosphotransferase (EC [uncultured Caballeronia sp.]